MTSRKFLNGQTAGKSRDGGTGYILEKSSQSIFSENISDNSCWLKVKLVEEKMPKLLRPQYFRFFTLKERKVLSKINRDISHGHFEVYQRSVGRKLTV